MRIKTLVVLLCGIASIAFGGLENAKVVHHSGGLPGTMQALRADDAWIAYELPTPSSRFVMCCMNWLGHGKSVSAKTCSLGRGGSSFMGPGSDEIGRIDASTMIVAVHQEGGAVRDVEVYSGGCPVDAGGKTVHVVDGVSADESLRVLDGVVGQAERHRGRNGALSAIAMHDSPHATQILEQLSVGNGNRELRGSAIFWLAQTGGRRGFEVAKRLANDDPDREIRKKAVFALTQSSDPEVFDALASLVRHHPEADTRSEA